MPDTCPSCGHEVVRDECGDGAAYRCVYPACPAQRARRIVHFASKGAMNIDGLGPQVVDLLLRENKIADIADLYELKVEDIYDTTRFWELSAFKLAEIQDVSGRALDGYISLSATNTKSSSCSFFIRKASGQKVAGYDITVNDWYKDSGEDIPEFDEPSFMIRDLEIQAQSKLIEIIRKYFDRDVFEKNKTSFFKHEVFQEQSVETPHELWVSLNVHKDHIYSILSILGYYQRHKGYFLSQSDFYKICYEYSSQVHYINRNLGMKYRFVNIFISSQRIKSSSKSDGEVDESYQSSKFIDVDKLSLIGLLQPYLKHNTNEIKQIIDIMMRNLRGRHGGLAWDSALEEVNNFISECESKGIMKRL
jgi:hypothetical protein